MIVVGVFMLAYVIFGGMLATTWVQIIKATLLMAAGVVLTVFVLAQGRLQPGRAVQRAPPRTTPKGDDYLKPGLQFDSGLALLSFGLAFVFGTAGLPHILMRFFTVPDAKAARGSVGWAVFLIGAFYLMVMIVGVGARGDPRPRPARRRPARPATSRSPSWRETSAAARAPTGGDIFLAVISAVALATILAVVAGLVISASGAVAHDLWSNVVRKGRDSEKEEVWVAKVAAIGIGVLAIALALAGGAGFNVSVLVGLAFCFASSVNVPGAAAGAVVARASTPWARSSACSAGLIASTVLIMLCATRCGPGRLRHGSPLGSLALDNPAIFCIPIGFLGCFLGTKLSTERGNEREYDELYVRSETGLGAEGAERRAMRGEAEARPEPAPEPVGTR